MFRGLYVWAEVQTREPPKGETGHTTNRPFFSVHRVCAAGQVWGSPPRPRRAPTWQAGNGAADEGQGLGLQGSSPPARGPVDVTGTGGLSEAWRSGGARACLSTQASRAARARVGSPGKDGVFA